MTLQEMIEEAQKLSDDERQLLMQALEKMSASTVQKAPGKEHTLLELAGLGADIWEGIDPQVYINQLRSEWDHRP